MSPEVNAPYGAAYTGLPYTFLLGCPMFDAIFWLAIGAGLFWYFTRRSSFEISDRVRPAMRRFANLNSEMCAFCAHPLENHIGVTTLKGGKGRCLSHNEATGNACTCENFR